MRELKMDKTIKAVTGWLEALDRRIFCGCLLVIVAILGYLDYLSGFEFAFSLFYVFPVALAAWFIGRNSGLVLSGISAIAWFVSNDMAGQTYSKISIGYWNTFIRLCFFIIITLLIASMKKALERERELSRTDSLTGLMNSRAFYQQAGAELQRAKRYKRPFTMAYIDIDGFKQVNDQEGHLTGDQVLRIVADTLRTRLRSTDYIARMGGDEFVALLPETEYTSGSVVISKLQASLLKAMDRHQWKITFSIGAVTFFNYKGSLKDAIQQADRLMYTAKAEGLNRIRFDTIE
jgi:diguanylate cyclase (GGDEF)-like protein